MTTEIFIENKRLDVAADISALLTFAIDDIREFSERSTTWSKTIVLPGTANNNKMFGHIFEIGSSNSYDESLPNVAYNFNASKSADCIIFQNNLQTFKGVLRLLEIISDRGMIEYEVAVFGELTGLNVALSSGKLEDLDFSEYDHVYNVINIVASWDNPGGSGYYYPLIDYGGYSAGKHDWDVRTFRPALYAKEYVDKMFAAAGYRYSSALFETDRFKKLIIPHNLKDLQKPSSGYLNALGEGDYSGLEEYAIEFTDIPTTGDFTYNSGIATFTYGGDTVTGELRLSMDLSFIKEATQTILIYLNINGVSVASDFIDYNTTEGTKTVGLRVNSQEITNGDVLQVIVRSGGTLGTPFSIGVHPASLSFAQQGGATVIVPVGYDEPFSLNFNLPKNIRQVDFLLSIVKLFNLYVYEDRFDSRLIHITPFTDFYTGGVVDWTYKLNRDKPIRLKPMSELNAKVYEFKYKPDSDYYNELYRKRYGMDYGTYIFDSQFEFSQQKESLELIFSPTPLVGYDGVDKVYPSIFKQSNSDSSTDKKEERVDSNIRILQSKKITGVSSWGILNEFVVLNTQTAYPYAGHLDDPSTPETDLNFGAPAEVFFTLTSGDLSNNQFGLYWSDYMREITDKDSKLLTASFYLTPKDIHSLDFSQYIHIDGVLFRLNKIIDYNLSDPAECLVELLKVRAATHVTMRDFDTWSQDGMNEVVDGRNNIIRV